MPRKPTGNPRGRPRGSGELDAPQRITVWLSGDLYRQLEAYAEGRHYHRGTPVLASCVRELLAHALACPYKQQTENVPVPEQEMVSLPIADLPALPALSLADRGLLPDCPAVYFVLDETCTVLYVGYTASLRTRWKSHHRLESFRQLEPIRIAWLAVDDAARLSTFEQDCIEQLNPPFNVQRPSGLPTTPLQVKLRETEIALIDEVAAHLAEQRHGIPYKRSEALRIAATEGARFLLARQEAPAPISDRIETVPPARGEEMKRIETVPEVQGDEIQRIENVPPTREDILAQIAAWREDDRSFDAIAKELNAAGIPTFSGKGTWNKGTVQKQLAKVAP